MKKILICISLSSFLVLSVLGAAYAEVIIITNKDVNETTLSREDIKEIFLGKKVQWKDNSKIRFVTLTGGDLHREFLKNYVNRSATQYLNYWKKMLFTGRGEPPKGFKTLAELIAYVKKTSGAIGYIDARRHVQHVNIINVK